VPAAAGRRVWREEVKAKDPLGEQRGGSGRGDASGEGKEDGATGRPRTPHPRPAHHPKGSAAGST